MCSTSIKAGRDVEKRTLLAFGGWFTLTLLLPPDPTVTVFDIYLETSLWLLPPLALAIISYIWKN